MDLTNIACIGSTKAGTAGILRETLETPIDCRLTVGWVESGPTVRFCWSIAFFALATSLFAYERLNALVSAVQDFSVAIQEQLAAVQSDISATQLIEKRRFDGRMVFVPGQNARVPRLYLS
jgi:hypothetical protein